MHRAQHGSSHVSAVRRERRLVAGIAVSVLLHGLLLSLQFGVPGLDAGPGGPIQVTLAPPPPAVAPAPLPELPVPAPPPPPQAALPPAPAPAQGLRLVDPLPRPAEPAPAPPPRQVARKPARPKLAKRRPSVAPPLIASNALDNPFAVAPSLPEFEPGPALEMPIVEEKERAADEAMVAARAQERLRDEEAARLAALEEELLRRARETEERLAVEQELARQEARQLAERAQAAARQDEERLRAAQAAQAAQERLAAERQAAERLAQQQAEDERRRREAEAQMAQQELAQLREREEARAREQARQLAAREAEQRLAQEAERRRLEEAAQRQAAQQAARRLAEERAEAERLARQRAEEAALRAAGERLQAGTLPGEGAAAGPGAGRGAGDGSTAGDGARGAAPIASRAREMLRGLNLPNVAPPPARPAFMQPNARRALADGSEREAALRLYVNSVRQKLERNAVLGDARFGRGEVRADPVVSVSLRSDGSIDDVVIVRSSGGPDMDEAVRRFVHLNARYAAFPPNVAARFDVIEIRRVWAFAEGLKLLEELR